MLVSAFALWITETRVIPPWRKTFLGGKKIIQEFRVAMCLCSILEAPDMGDGPHQLNEELGSTQPVLWAAG